ncbi:MAG: HDIG domain-containing protein [Bacteroidia bacterium]|nr:HDIG domain-containing protein [Bacteroidia bacterium]
MLNFFSKLANKHSEIYKVLAFLLSIAVIVFVFPHQGKFKYDLHNIKGKPWNYEDLIAPVDFAIVKTADQLSNERSEVYKNAKAYFKLDKNVYPAKMSELELGLDKLLEKRSTRVKQNLYSLCISLVDSLYKRGIIQLNEVFETKPADYSVYVMNDSVAEEHDLGEFFTVQTADEYIKAKLKSYNSSETNALVPLLENVIAQNIFWERETSEKVLKQELENISLTHGGFVKDQSVILKGEIVDAEKYQVLESLRAEYEEQLGGNVNFISVLIGQTIVVSLCLLVLAIFLIMFRKDIFLDNSKITFILFLIVLMVATANLSIRYDKFNLYVLPFCMLPVIVRAFFDTRLALFAHIVTTLIIAFVSSNRFEYVFVQIVAGMVAIFSVINLRNRSQFFLTSVLVFAAYIISFIGINIVQEGSFTGINWSVTEWFGISALLTSFSYPLIFVFERTFGFLSDVSLMELSDTNSPLLRELASKAPGTFQHSLQVANIAEEVIYQIGGDPLLVRTGALYHDIGKMEAPIYFIENQTAEINPHNELSYEESAAILIRHVTHGIELAKKHKLPQQIIDFIRTHHGTTTTYYFYKMYKRDHPDEQFDESIFHYPGPIPFSKETAVLMMADGVEAASRSLKSYSEQSIQDLVDKIIDSQIALNQFVNADITFRDINIIKKILKKKLISIYHVRVEYPR